MNIFQISFLPLELNTKSCTSAMKDKLYQIDRTKHWILMLEIRKDGLEISVSFAKIFHKRINSQH